MNIRAALLVAVVALLPVAYAASCECSCTIGTSRTYTVDSCTTNECLNLCYNYCSGSGSYSCSATGSWVGALIYFGIEAVIALIFAYYIRQRRLGMGLPVDNASMWAHFCGCFCCGILYCCFYFCTESNQLSQRTVVVMGGQQGYGGQGGYIAPTTSSSAHAYSGQPGVAVAVVPGGPQAYPVGAHVVAVPAGNQPYGQPYAQPYVASGYPPQQGGYPPQQGGYPPQGYPQGGVVVATAVTAPPPYTTDGPPPPQ